MLGTLLALVVAAVAVGWFIWRRVRKRRAAAPIDGRRAAAGRATFAAVCFHGFGKVLAEVTADAPAAAELGAAAVVTLVVVAGARSWSTRRA